MACSTSGRSDTLPHSLADMAFSSTCCIVQGMFKSSSQLSLAACFLAISGNFVAFLAEGKALCLDLVRRQSCWFDLQQTSRFTEDLHATQQPWPVEGPLVADSTFDITERSPKGILCRCALGAIRPVYMSTAMEEDASSCQFVFAKLVL